MRKDLSPWRHESLSPRRLWSPRSGPGCSSSRAPRRSWYPGWCLREEKDLRTLGHFKCQTLTFKWQKEGFFHFNKRRKACERQADPPSSPFSSNLIKSKIPTSKLKVRKALDGKGDAGDEKEKNQSKATTELIPPRRRSRTGSPLPPAASCRWRSRCPGPV